MGKAAKQHVGKTAGNGKTRLPRTVANQDHFHRLNYLYQLGHWNQIQGCQALSRMYLQNLDLVSKRTRTALLPSVKRTVCKRCKTLQVPFQTCQMRLRDPARTRMQSLPRTGIDANCFKMSFTHPEIAHLKSTSTSHIESDFGQSLDNGVKPVASDDDNSGCTQDQAEQSGLSQSVTVATQHTASRAQVLETVCLTCGTTKRYPVGQGYAYMAYHERSGNLVELER